MDSSSRRRQLVRRVIGKPGSLPRWVFGTGLWLAVCGIVVLRTGNFAVIIFAAVVSVGALVARSLMVGDEDEFNAYLRHSVIRSLRGAPPDTIAEPRGREEAGEFPAEIGGRLEHSAPPPPPVAESEDPRERPAPPGAPGDGGVVA